MNTQLTPTSWQEVTIEHIGLAYRKAKVDCFRERGQFTALAFASYERNLAQNLKELHNTVVSGRDAILNLLKREIEPPQILSKRLDIRDGSQNKRGHRFVSTADAMIRSFRAHRRQKNADEETTLVPQLRITGSFGVNAHIFSALWINLVGHRLDQALDQTAYGSRLRRIRSADTLCQPQPLYHTTALGSFVPYFRPYQQWRNNAMEAARRELEAGNSVLVLTLDLKSYYHSVDPSFAKTAGFLASLGVSLSPFERMVNDLLVDFLLHWQVHTRSHLQLDSHFPIGLPIGLTAPRVLANVLLAEWDRHVQQRVMPIHYGRYVDDMVFVLRDPGESDIDQTGLSILARMLNQPNSELLAKDGENFVLKSTFDSGSRLTFQPSKGRSFFLAGASGLDLLDRIRAQIAEVSSERRLLPDPEVLEDRAAARVLIAGTENSDVADSLGRAETLTLRRLGWSLQLRATEILGRDLPPAAWSRQRNAFFAFAHRHILRFDRILEQGDHLSRLVGLAVDCRDWSDAARLVDCINSTLRTIEELSDRIQLNGTPVPRYLGAPQGEPGPVQENPAFKLVWQSFVKTIRLSLAEACLRAWPWRRVKSCIARPVDPPPEWRQIETALYEGTQLSSIPAPDFAVLLAEADLARLPLDLHRSYHGIPQESGRAGHSKIDLTLSEVSLLVLTSTWGKQRLQTIQEFINGTYRQRVAVSPDLVGPDVGEPPPKATDDQWLEDPAPYVFPTRPFTPERLAELVPACVDPANASMWRPSQPDTQRPDPAPLQRLVRALRGTWVRDDVAETPKAHRPGAARILRLGGKRNASPVVALGNYRTTEDAWRAAAAGEPLLTTERYSGLARLVNAVVDMRPRVDYLILPELSLPRAWVSTVSRQLIEHNISLISGVEYGHLPNRKVVNEAVVSLTDSRLGYPASIRIRQRKSRPAVFEEEQLLKIHGRTWATPLGQDFARNRLVYDHNGLSFGVVICSELQNVSFRVAYQGSVDALMIVSWNKDLKTFETLVDSAALDVHSYVVYSNDREYGDSRVRAPAKRDYKQDICRIRGGLHDYAVSARLELDLLRRFHSRDRFWPREDDPYKPCPEGFVISPHRKCVP